MNGYKTATVETENFKITVDLALNGDWIARNKDEHNALCELECKLDTALNRALDSDDGIGYSKDRSVAVTCHK